MNDYPVLRGVGYYLPAYIRDNHELERMVDTSDEWIRSRTGIVTRRIASPEETTASLGAEAARKALDTAGMHPGDIDIIIVATMSPDMLFPSTACLVQEKIGAANAAAFDISAACTGFIYGLAVASSMVRAGAARNVLLIGAEALSRVVDWQDRNTCVLFGDGAGAAVVSGDGDGGAIIETTIRSDGSKADLLFMPAGGAAQPATVDTVKNRLHFLKMTGKGLYREATTSMADAARAVLQKNGYTVEDMSLLVPHQANLRIIQSTAKKLDIPPEKAYVNIDKYGNTSAATIPIAIGEALENGSIGRGDLVVLVGFGSGMTVGATLMRF